MKTENRFAHIDLLETIAIMAVVCYHCSLYSFDIIANPGVHTYISYYFNSLLSVGVPLFFFANGYLLLSKDFDLKKHIFKTIRLTVITCIWAVIKILILMPVRGEMLSVKEIITKIWHLENGWVNTLWYMGALICIYILFPLIKNAFDNSKKTFTYFTIIAGILTVGNELINHLGTTALYILPLSDTSLIGINLFNMFNPFSGFPGYSVFYFCMGGMLLQYKERILSISAAGRNIICVATLLISTLLLTLLGCMYSHINGAPFDTVYSGYDSIFTFVNVICIFILCLGFTKDICLFYLISSCTLGIYLIHDIFIHILRPALLDIPLCNSIWFDMVFAAVLIGVCTVLSLIIKKIPLIKHLI